MASDRHTQFNFAMDGKKGEEYHIFDFHAGEVGDKPANVQKKPFGAALGEFMDMDIAQISQIRDALSMFAAIDSVDTYNKNWPEYKDIIWKIHGIAEELPPIFCDLLTVFNFYVNEYMVPPGARPIFGRADIDRLTKGAAIIRGHCDRIISRHGLLLREANAGHFSGGKSGKAAKILKALGSETAGELMEASINAHCILMERDGQPGMELCFSAGVDLGCFLTVCIREIMNSSMEVSLCQHCGKPFVGAGRSIYCDRPRDGGGTCRTVGAHSKYSRNLAENQFMGKYRKTYKKNYARMMKGTVTRQQFEGWRDKTRKKLDALLAGKATQEEFEKALNKL